MGNYHAPFWRAVGEVTPSLTLIVAAAQVVLIRGLAAVGQTVKMLAEGKFVGIPVTQESPGF